jgi:hypothetical protein
MPRGTASIEIRNTLADAGHVPEERIDLRPRLRLLVSWIERVAHAQAFSWFRESLDLVAAAENRAALPRALALAPRRLGKADLPLDGEDFRAANEVRTSFDPTGLTVDQAARIALLLASYREGSSFARMLEALCRTADIGELVSFYRGLVLFLPSDDLTRRAREGARSGIKPVFEAVAHRNPYPRECFDQHTWNQMVLKALFIGSELNLIQGLDERANADLSVMLIDYAHERWAAQRPVSIELWRALGPYVDDRATTALQRLLQSGDPRDRAAAVLALSTADHPHARSLLASDPDTYRAVKAGRITWQILQEAAA